MKKIIKILLLCLPIFCSAHPKEAYTWLMAPNTGLQFSQTADVNPFVFDYQYYEGYGFRAHIAVISDTNGNMLYFSPEIFVYNNKYDTISKSMLTSFGNAYSKTSMILQFKQKDIDFLFLNTNGSGLIDAERYYHSFGIRELFSLKDPNLWYCDTVNTGISPTFVCIKDPHKDEIWLLTNFENTLYTHKITASGLKKYVFKRQDIYQRPNHLKVSPNGKKILSLSKVGKNPNIIIYNYDNSLGKITNSESIFLNYENEGNGYSLSQSADFSYDGRYIYVYQANGLFLIDSEDDYAIYEINMSGIVDDDVFDMSLAPDGRMYIAYFESGIYRINSTPEEIKNNVINLQKICEYQFNNMNHPNNYRFPKFMNDCFDFHIEFTVANPCDISSGTSLSAYKSNIPAGSSWHWSCPDGTSSDNLILSEAEVLQHGLGKYYFETDNGFVKLKDSIDLADSQPLTVSIVSDKDYLCPGEELNLKAASTGQTQSYLWSTGSEAQEIVVTQPGKYSVEVKDKFNCAQTAEIEIINAGDMMDIIGETVKITSFPYEKSQNIDIEVKNTLNQAIGIQSINFINKSFMEVVDFPAQLEAKESKTINLKISPKQYGSLTDTIVIKYENDCNLDERALFKADIYLKTKIICYTVNSETNQSIVLPFYAIPAGNYKGTKPEHFICVLRMDTTFFYFKTSNKTVESNSIKNGKREVTISGTIDGINLSDPIFIINGSTNDSVGSSKIEIVSFNWDNVFISADTLHSASLNIFRTSVDDETSDEYISYTNETLNLSSINLEQKNVKIYNILGDAIYKNSFSNNMTIDVSKFQIGVYFVVLESNGMVLTRYKFIKN